MTKDDEIKELSQLMQAKRDELIAKPLSRIWDDLAKVAVEYYERKKQNEEYQSW